MAASASRPEALGVRKGIESVPDVLLLRDFRALNIDRDFERHRPGRGGERHSGGFTKRIDCSDRLPNAQVMLADGLEHVGLTRHVVDRGAIAIHELAIHLRGDVENG